MYSANEINPQTEQCICLIVCSQYLFANYGSDLYMMDVKEKYPVDYLWNAGDGHGNYFNMNVTVGGEMPYGSENGDKAYIIVVFNGSLAGYIETAYEYQWVRK